MIKKLILFVTVLMWSILVATAQPTATNFGINDASGNPNTFVQVPVNITNVQNGPIAGIIFDINFNPNVINLTEARITKGDLTSGWDAPEFNSTKGRISIVYNHGTEIPNGSSGSVIILNFSVVGAPGAKSIMNISRIQLSDVSGFKIGTAPAKNGTFTITSAPTAPAITSWSNNKTNDANLSITVNVSESVKFNASANQSVTWRWFVNDSNQNNNFDNLSYPFASVGNYIVKVNATNANGTSNIVTWNINAQAPPGAPAITSWGNNKTNDASLSITVNVSETVRFNATANQSVTLWRWYVNETNQSNNFDSLSYHFTTAGNFIIKVNASNANGISNTVTWSVNVKEMPTTGSITGQIMHTNNGTGISSVLVNLTNTSGVVASTTTNDSGHYNFSNIAPGSYNVNASMLRFFRNSTIVVLNATETKEVNLMFWLKGDINNNGEPADAGDLVLMKRASIGEIDADFRFDLNNNGEPADAGDLVLMKRASIGEIELL